MPEMGGLIAPLALALSAALTGCAVAHLCRVVSVLRRGQVSLLEAGWFASLPALAVLLLPLAFVFPPDTIAPVREAHEGWHLWQEWLHRTPWSHGVLHAANALFLLGVLVQGVRTIYVLARMWGFEVDLRSSAKQAASGEHLLLQTDRSTCFTVGVFRPAVYLTTGLRDRLSSRDMEAVIAHEMAHVRRWDPLWIALLTLLYTLVPLPGASRLLAGWRQSVECACDQEAARVVGDPLAVASALVRVAQLQGNSHLSLPAGVAFGPCHESLDERVAALLDDGLGTARSPWEPALLTGMSTGMTITASLWLPHLAELFAHH